MRNPNLITVGTPKAFSNGITDFSTHLRYSQVVGFKQSIHLSIHIGCYYSGLTWLQKLADHLKAQVTFESEFGEFTVDKLAGPCYENIPCVEVTAKFKCSDYQAVKALRKMGFYPRLESYK